jgi:hypothetical protein
VQCSIWGFCEHEDTCTGPHKLASDYWKQIWKKKHGKKRSDRLQGRNNQPQEKRKYNNKNGGNRSTGWGENGSAKRQAIFSALQKSLALEEEKAAKLSQEIETLRMEKEADEKQKEDKAVYKIAKKKAKRRRPRESLP